MTMIIIIHFSTERGTMEAKLIAFMVIMTMLTTPITRQSLYEFLYGERE